MTLLKPEVRNPNLDELNVDFLYHLGLDTSMDLKKMFGDVKFVLMGGSADRAKKVAEMLQEEFNPDGKPDWDSVDNDPVEIPEHITDPLEATAYDAAQRVLRVERELIKAQNNELKPIGKTERFSLYKVGPVISVNHGMGMPSMTILLHEITKLLDYAGAEDVEFIRIGTSGGIGVEPGTVVIAKEGVNAKLKSLQEDVILGKVRKTKTKLDKKLAKRLYKVRGDVAAVMGKTMGTDCFYEGQARLDGALDPGYSEADKMAFLKKAHKKGVRNIEMESPAFAAFFRRAKLPAAVVNTALLNRLEGDQVTSTPEQLAEYSERAQRLVIQYIRSRLKSA